MGDKCERCSLECGGVKFRDESELPENVEPGYFCDDCLERMKKKWWDNEKLAYIYDNEGNRADDPDYDPENTWMEDGDD